MRITEVRIKIPVKTHFLQKRETSQNAIYLLLMYYLYIAGSVSSGDEGNLFLLVSGVKKKKNPGRCQLCCFLWFPQLVVVPCSARSSCWTTFQFIHVVTKGFSSSWVTGLRFQFLMSYWPSLHQSVPLSIKLHQSKCGEESSMSFAETEPVGQAQTLVMLSMTFYYSS